MSDGVKYPTILQILTLISGSDRHSRGRCDMAMLEWGAAERTARELQVARAALRAWEHWYSEDSTEHNRDSAREMGLRALDRGPIVKAR